VAKIARINNIDSADIVFLLEQRPLNTDQNNLSKYSNQKEERENIFSVDDLNNLILHIKIA
jgi:hypothetical protein